jgi:glycosyltransferase involved in cell wall biosynthesis
MDRIEIQSSAENFTFCVCTFNSAETISSCLSSIRSIAQRSQLLVIDHFSSDGTAQIAASFGAKIMFENVGLGHARQLCFDNVSTQFIAFVDADVEIVRSDFLAKSTQLLQEPTCGAVVGVSIEHRFSYGLPASLLVLRKRDFEGPIIPDFIDARETFFIQRRLDKNRMSVAYLPASMIHRSKFRRYKPEWEGANTRILPSPLGKELIFTSKVILLLTLNSRSFKNLAYLPLFYAKFLRGFLNPSPWLRLRRIEGE